MDKYGGLKSDALLASKSSVTHQQCASDTHLRKSHSVQWITLDLERFLALPMEIISRVCRFLHPVSLIALSRTTRKLRAKFMTKTANPLWDAARFMDGMPPWRTMAPPQAAAVLYELECQGLDCDAKYTSIQAFHLGRRYCVRCARKNILDLKEIQEWLPDLPEKLVRCLPWTARRNFVPHSSSGKQQFFLRSDVWRLHLRLQSLQPLSDHVKSTIRKELLAFQEERKTATLEVERWYKGHLRSQRLQVGERWDIIKQVLQNRWGWSPTEYNRLGPFLRPIVDRLIEAPVLTEAEWNSVRGDVPQALDDEAKRQGRGKEPRPYKLRD